METKTISTLQPKVENPRTHFQTALAWYSAMLRERLVFGNQIWNRFITSKQEPIEIATSLIEAMNCMHMDLTSYKPYVVDLYLLGRLPMSFAKWSSARKRHMCARIVDYIDTFMDRVLRTSCDSVFRAYHELSKDPTKKFIFIHEITKYANELAGLKLFSLEQLIAYISEPFVVKPYDSKKQGRGYA